MLFRSIFTSIPFSNFGATIIKAEMNWLEIFPGIFTSPPLILPKIDIGGVPLDELQILVESHLMKLKKY